jgi:hypothetical protein
VFGEVAVDVGVHDRPRPVGAERGGGGLTRGGRGRRLGSDEHEAEKDEQRGWQKGTAFHEPRFFAPAPPMSSYHAAARVFSDVEASAASKAQA